jgi:hypothetical protein
MRAFDLLFEGVTEFTITILWINVVLSCSRPVRITRRASHKRKPRLDAGAAFTLRISGFTLVALRNPRTRGV